MTTAPQRPPLTQGHLALVDWTDDAPAARPAEADRPPLADPVRRYALDRWYDRSVLALLAVTIAAVAVSLH